MICPGCSKAAEAALARGEHSHDPNMCHWSTNGCDCKHGQPSKPEPLTITERMHRFKGTTGVAGYMSKLGPTGANLHPDRCKCQGDETTPHKHYNEFPHSCARCSECSAYEPALPQ